jgi:signal transduction histidine kinase
VDERTRELADALDELRVVDRLKDDFLASMSHELLTPLQSIASAGEILTSVAGDAGPSAAADRREFAGVVQREAVRLTGMLRAVLELSQFEAGKVDMVLESLDLREAVISAHQRHREAFHATESRLKVRVEEGMPRVAADPDWVGRVLDALLSNAVKFGARGQEVGVTISREGEAAVVEVRDRGPGVPEALRASVFEKFKQAGDILTDKPAGLGLGLPTARLLVERMGGRIWHEPRAGSGSAFLFTLPVAVPAAVGA